MEQHLLYSRSIIRDDSRIWSKDNNRGVPQRLYSDQSWVRPQARRRRLMQLSRICERPKKPSAKAWQILY
ncbi:hypothetical protein CY34DRAFT_656894 [Suillus luteus UH-Slu-Lm8-n1]|uniref:Uncharacterized protein n=1 Tax=Suillus luteus UH-Slu-Lm8-n1 TaxID=930992 RepID=A0A0D0A2B1_9AGAM|nr:hypothetical protein CY34DRAFT_656894 [Suillus luteus UH-Slu-Lm8-n1]